MNHCIANNLVGNTVKQTVHLTGGAGAKIYRCFRVSGFVEVVALYGVFTDVTSVVTASNASWDLNNGALTAPLSINVDCSGVLLNSVIMKSGLAAAAPVLLNTAAILVQEVANTTPFLRFAINPTTAVTYLRFNVTQDANTNALIDFYAIWVPRSMGSTIVPA